MRIVSYSQARNNLKSVFDQTIDDADVTIVTRREGQNAVVMGEEYYNSLMETLHLLSSPRNAAHLAQSIAEFRAGNTLRKALLDADDSL